MIISHNLETKIILNLENKPKLNFNCDIKIILIQIKNLLFNQQFNV